MDWTDALVIFGCLLVAGWFYGDIQYMRGRIYENKRRTAQLAAEMAQLERDYPLPPQ